MSRSERYILVRKLVGQRCREDSRYMTHRIRVIRMEGLTRTRRNWVRALLPASIFPFPLPSHFLFSLGWLAAINMLIKRQRTAG